MNITWRYLPRSIQNGFEHCKSSTCSKRVMYHGIVGSKIRIGTSTPCDIIGQTERADEVLM